MQTVKQALYQKCEAYVQKRIDTANSAMQDAQSSANSETKSTAGDKHDTARAMMQLAAEQNAKHLAEANKLKQVLHLINPEQKSIKGELGSLVIASNGNFYISVSVGKIELNGTIYFAISPTSPMGTVLKNLNAGDKTNFNHLSIEIKEVM